MDLAQDFLFTYLQFIYTFSSLDVREWFLNLGQISDVHRTSNMWGVALKENRIENTSVTFQLFFLKWSKCDTQYNLFYVFEQDG